MTPGNSQPQQQHQDDGQLVTVEEASRLLAVSKSSLYNLMENGRLRYVKLGKSRRLRRADLAALVEASTVERAPAATS